MSLISFCLTTYLFLLPIFESYYQICFLLPILYASPLIFYSLTLIFTFYHLLECCFVFFFPFLFLIFFLLIQNRTGVILQKIEKWIMEVLLRGEVVKNASLDDFVICYHSIIPKFKFVDICRVINLHHKRDLSLRKLNIICRWNNLKRIWSTKTVRYRPSRQLHVQS